MKIYIAKDWTGVHAFKDVPKLENCGGLPPIWTGPKFKELDESASYAEDDIPKGQYIERDAYWSIVCSYTCNKYQL